MCVCTRECVPVLTSTNRKSHGLPAFTGTLSTIPRDIRVGYVTAIPKFNTILNAEIKNKRWVSLVTVLDLPFSGVF